MKVAVVPQIEGLSIMDFIEYAQRKPNVMRHLPDEGGWNHMDKKWICDVIYTIDAQGF